MQLADCEFRTLSKMAATEALGPGLGLSLSDTGFKQKTTPVKPLLLHFTMKHPASCCVAAALLGLEVFGPLGYFLQLSSLPISVFSVCQP